MKKIFKLRYIALALGIILFVIGALQSIAYESSLEKGRVVDAVVSNVETFDDFEDSGYEHKIYISYSYNGEEHVNEYYNTLYDNSYHSSLSVGDTVEVVVGEDGGQLSDGGILVIGLVITVICVALILKDRKANKVQ